MDVPDECWVHPALQIQPSAIEGQGLFASSVIEPGQVVMRMGGRLVTRAELTAMLVEPGEYIDTISVSDGIDLVLPPGQLNHFANHSCDPNVWHVDAFTVAARRPIARDDEVVIDYATHSDGDDFSFECSCGSDLCRRVVTGGDWRRPELQERYGDHWVPALLAKIRGVEATEL